MKRARRAASVSGLMSKPSLRTIADACGVSTATVSRALSGHPAVRPTVREEIVAAARRHGYKRNDLVGKLMSHVRGGRTQRLQGNLAVVHVPAPGQPRLLPAHRRIIAGATERARELSFQLYEFSLGRDGLGTVSLARLLHARGVQGVIVLYTEPTDAMADFPWADFSSIAIDYGRNEPLLHTVCVDHYMTLMGALTGLRAKGFRRIGMFLERFKDVRIAQKWSAAMAAFQQSGELGQVPTLVMDRIDARGFRRWYRDYRPDLVIGHLDDAVVWLQQEGVRVPVDAAFFSLNWNARRRPCAGLDLRMDLQGAVAAEALIAQVERGERGLPRDPRTIMFRGKWVDGPTLPR